MLDSLTRWCITALAMLQRLAPPVTPARPKPSAIFAQCSWCGSINEMSPHGETTCDVCRHRADVERISCNCDRCIKAARGASHDYIHKRARSNGG